MINGQLWEQKMVVEDIGYGSETYRIYLDIEIRKLNDHVYLQPVVDEYGFNRQPFNKF